MSKQGVAIVTGSAQGIGRAIALRLAQDGFDVALNDLPTKEEQLQLLLKEITSIGRKCIIVVADISSEEQVKVMIDNTVSALGSTDVVGARVHHHQAETFNATYEWSQMGPPFRQGVFLTVSSSIVHSFTM